MSISEIARHHPEHPNTQGERIRQFDVVCSSNVMNSFLGYAHMTPGPEADAKLRKILKKTRGVSPHDVPKHLKTRKGVQPQFFAHPFKPGIVYMGWEERGVRYFDKVIIYDKEGRPGYRQS
ncbi:hypothetical protein KBC14_03030 [Candidatus Woesebacteria bacterium]|jgi:hypothetical protein|nr:hypothetical protein [Candidatus Woesebacteria bacterium]MBP6883337.1 hypothetical protein [Candidatus Woesebacteria bacterium]